MLRRILSTISKFDIRISTSPVIKGLEFYYKIWILKRGTKKKAYIKKYYPLKLIDEERYYPNKEYIKKRIYIMLNDLQLISNDERKIVIKHTQEMTHPKYDLFPTMNKEYSTTYWDKL